MLEDAGPAPHILYTLAGPASEDAYNKIGWVLVLQKEGIYSDEEIAQKVGFGSVEAMHTQLGDWGLPGLLPERTVSSSQQPKQRNAKSGARTEARSITQTAYLCGCMNVARCDELP